MRGKRGFNPLTALLAAAMSCALIFGAVSAGMYVPAQETLSGITSQSALDYSRFPGKVARLSANFISKALGFGPIADAGSSSRGNRGTVLANMPGSGRTVVEHGLTNDDFEKAYAVPSIPFTAHTNTQGASRQNEPASCAPTGGTVWYRYRPLRDEGLIVNTIGTKHAISLAAFTGSDATHLTQVVSACHTSIQGSAYVTFPAKKMTTYYFQVTQVASGGPLVFNLDPLGTTERLSKTGEPKPSMFPAMSADGRYVAFDSAATDLVPGDTNGQEDVFVYDLLTARTERVSVRSDGQEGKDGESKPWPPAISADGRYVAFTSEATNLVDGDTNGWEDVFLHDRVTHETTRISVSSSGGQGTPPLTPYGEPLEKGVRAVMGSSDGTDSYGSVSISADGRLIAFDTSLVGLVPEDGPNDDPEYGYNGLDAFVHDRITGKTTLVSASSSGENADNLSGFPDISADGRFVAFTSQAKNLLPPDGQARGDTDVYMKDLKTAKTELVSATNTGVRGNGLSRAPAISADGRFVAFSSNASDLVPSGNDVNNQADFFVRDRILGRTEIISLSTEGEQQQVGETYEQSYLQPPKPAISWDGRYVAFHSDAPNLVPGDSNGFKGIDSNDSSPNCTEGSDVFMRDRSAATTTRISITSSGEQGKGASFYPSMSADARLIAYVSKISVAEDQGPFDSTVCSGQQQIFLHTIPVLH